MAKISDIVKELQDLSNQISLQVRTIALSLLALSWGLLVGAAPVHVQISDNERTGLIRIGLVAILVLLIDFLQYLSGYKDALTVLTTAEAKGLQEASYDSRSLLYRLRGWLFRAKTWMIFVASAYLFYLLFPRIL